MISTFFPDLYIENVFQLPIEDFIKKGIKAIIFDIDNTIAPFDEEEATKEILDFIKGLQEKGFQIGILSNNNKKRVEKFNEKINVVAIYKAGKPGTTKLSNVIFGMGLKASEVALVGDQVFTDVFCAKRLNTLAVLTQPICDRDQLVTKVKRGLEKQVIKLYKRSLAK